MLSKSCCELLDGGQPWLVASPKNKRMKTALSVSSTMEQSRGRIPGHMPPLIIHRYGRRTEVVTPEVHISKARRRTAFLGARRRCHANSIPSVDKQNLPLLLVHNNQHSPAFAASRIYTQPAPDKLRSVLSKKILKSPSAIRFSRVSPSSHVHREDSLGENRSQNADTIDLSEDRSRKTIAAGPPRPHTHTSISTQTWLESNTAATNQHSRPQRKTPPPPLPLSPSD